MANKIKELRDSCKMKQIDLATYLNVSQGTLSNWERGIHDPDNETLIRIAEKFNVSSDYVLCRTSDPTPPDTKKEAPSELDSKEAFRQALIKEGVIPADRPLTDEERDKLAALADAFLNGGRK